MLEPTKRGLFQPLAKMLALGGSDFADSISARFAHVEIAAQDKFGWLSRSLGLNPVRLATAYAVRPPGRWSVLHKQDNRCVKLCEYYWRS